MDTKFNSTQIKYVLSFNFFFFFFGINYLAYSFVVRLENDTCNYVHRLILLFERFFIFVVIGHIDKCGFVVVLLWLTSQGTIFILCKRQNMCVPFFTFQEVDPPPDGLSVFVAHFLPLSDYQLIEQRFERSMLIHARMKKKDYQNYLHHNNNNDEINFRKYSDLLYCWEFIFFYELI